jgi:hypothetical protein
MKLKFFIWTKYEKDNNGLKKEKNTSSFYTIVEMY